jgi:GHMP kinase-like protein
VSPPAVEVAAHAKANLFLRVLAREADGYHGIETLFCRLDLADTLRAERREGQGVTVEVSGADVGPPEANLAVRAAQTVLEALEHRFAVHLRLTKRIPVGAGLGGGSADAAAALAAVNRLAGDAVPRHELLQFAARLGSEGNGCCGSPPCPRLPVWSCRRRSRSRRRRRTAGWMPRGNRPAGAVRWHSTSMPSPAGVTSPGWRATTSSRRSSPGTPRSARRSRHWSRPIPSSAG